MADVVKFRPRQEEEEEETPTEFTHDWQGALLPPGSYSRAAGVDNTSMPDKHLPGKAQCMLCDHVADVKVPVGAFPLDCPSCKQRYMILKLPPSPREVWTCNCGCEQFYLTRKLPVCVACGNATQDWANS